MRQRGVDFAWVGVSRFRRPSPPVEEASSRSAALARAGPALACVPRLPPTVTSPPGLRPDPASRHGPAWTRTPSVPPSSRARPLRGALRLATLALPGLPRRKAPPRPRRSLRARRRRKEAKRTIPPARRSFPVPLRASRARRATRQRNRSLARTRSLWRSTWRTWTSPPTTSTLRPLTVRAGAGATPAGGGVGRLGGAAADSPGPRRAEDLRKFQEDEVVRVALSQVRGRVGILH